MQLSLSGTAPYADEVLIEKLFSAAVYVTHISPDIALSIAVVTAAESKRLNVRYRQKDSATDVLSFGYYKDVSEVPKQGVAVLGDLILSRSFLKKQALLYGHTLADEFFFLITHGFLHLLGYDHETPQEFQEMKRKTLEILKDFQKRRVRNSAN